MACIPRLTMAGEPAVYHVISRTALDGFVLGEAEKDYLLTLLQRLSAVYFTVRKWGQLFTLASGAGCHGGRSKPVLLTQLCF